MVITYQLFLWNGRDGYINLRDGLTSRIRYKKLNDGVEISPNIDIDLPISILDSITDPDLQTIIDAAFDADEARDAAEITESEIVIPAVVPRLSSKSKRTKPKTRTVGPPPGIPGNGPP